MYGAIALLVVSTPEHGPSLLDRASKIAISACSMMLHPQKHHFLVVGQEVRKNGEGISETRTKHSTLTGNLNNLFYIRESLTSFVVFVRSRISFSRKVHCTQN